MPLPAFLLIVYTLSNLETCLRQTTTIFVFFFNPFSLSSLIYCFIISLLHFFSLDFNSYFFLLIYFSTSFLILSVPSGWVSSGAVSRVSRGLIRLMDIRNWCNETVHSSAELRLPAAPPRRDIIRPLGEKPVWSREFFGHALGSSLRMHYLEFILSCELQKNCIQYNERKTKTISIVD